MTGVIGFDIANVTGTSIDPDGFQVTQWDAEGEENAGVAASQAHHMFGSWGRAPDAVVEPGTQGAVGAGEPDPSRSAACLVGHEGGVAHVFDLEHVPTIANLPTPAGGEHLSYSIAGCFTRHMLDGSVVRSTTDTGGAAHAGTTIADWMRPTGFTRDAPWGRETFDNTGFRVKAAGGAKLSLGFVSGLPPPLNGGQSYFRALANIVEINGGAISIGPTASDLESVAKAPQLVTVLTSLAAAIQAVQLALATITTSTPGATAALASAPAVAAAQTAVAGALALISTQTAIG